MTACSAPIRPLAIVAATLAVLVVVAGACGSTQPIANADAQPVVTAPPNQSLTSYGAQFLTTCVLSHSSPNDPIVHFGKPGSSHQHEFFGNTSTDASSTFASLVKSPSTCSDDGDRSAYWVPVLLINGTRVAPKRVDAYYRVASGVVAASVAVYPDGLQAIAGDQHGTKAPSLQVAAWTCGLSPHLSHEPPKDCTTDRPVQLRLTFPSCWDGEHVSAPDFTSHLSYPTASGCVAPHPVALPQLTLVVHYPLTGMYRTAGLVSGSFDTTHGDFFEAWQPDRIRDQVTGCINRNVTCGIVGGTFHTGQGSGDEDYYDHPGAGATAPGGSAYPGASPTSGAGSSMDHMDATSGR